MNKIMKLILIIGVAILGSAVVCLADSSGISVTLQGQPICQMTLTNQDLTYLDDGSKGTGDPILIGTTTIELEDNNELPSEAAPLLWLAVTSSEFPRQYGNKGSGPNSMYYIQVGVPV